MGSRRTRPNRRQSGESVAFLAEDRLFPIPTGCEPRHKPYLPLGLQWWRPTGEMTVLQAEGVDGARR